MKNIIKFHFVSLFIFLLGLSTKSIANVTLESTRIAGHRVLFQFDENNVGDGIDVDFPFVIFQKTDGVFLVGISLCLITYDEKRNLWANFEKNPPKSILLLPTTIGADSKGTLWFYSRATYALHSFDGQNWRRVDDASFFTPISTFFPGRNGKLWVGCREGVLSYDGSKWSPVMAPPEAIKKAYAELRKKPATRLEASLARLEDQMREQKRKLKDPEPILSADETEDGLQDSKGVLWIGTRKAVLKIVPESNTWQIYSLPKPLISASRVYEDRKGRIWIADENGHAAFYDRVSDRWQSYDLAAQVHEVTPDGFNQIYGVKVIYQDQRGQVMFGTRRGLIIFAEKESRWYVETPLSSGLPDTRITCMYEDHQGRIWVGTAGGIVVLAP